MDYDHPGRFLDFSLKTALFRDGSPVGRAANSNLAPYDFLLYSEAQDTWEENEHSWMLEEKAAIREWVGTGPNLYFGVCLGHQLLCDALGGEVQWRLSRKLVFEVSLTDDGMDHALFPD
jgi:GMP synthase-like glutamine amidotransferase